MKKKAKRARRSPPPPIKPTFSPSPIKITIPLDQEAVIQYGDKLWSIKQGKLRSLSVSSSSSSSLSP
jgi:hypothetical protein